MLNPSVEPRSAEGFLKLLQALLSNSELYFGSMKKHLEHKGYTKRGLSMVL